MRLDNTFIQVMIVARLVPLTALAAQVGVVHNVRLASMLITVHVSRLVLPQPIPYLKQENVVAAPPLVPAVLLSTSVHNAEPTILW